MVIKYKQSVILLNLFINQEFDLEMNGVIKHYIKDKNYFFDKKYVILRFISKIFFILNLLIVNP